MNAKTQACQAFGNFRADGGAVSCERYGNGHINDTYRVITETGGQYILQKVNTKIFTRPKALMENIAAVCAHVGRKVSDPRGALTLVPALSGENHYTDASGGFWRVYDFVTDSLCLETVENPRDFYESAVGFGQFQKMLTDFDAKTLHETIADFHNTPKRYEKLKKALAEDKYGRKKAVKSEIDFALSREKDGSLLWSLLQSGRLPLRVTHNDTKLNNVLFDAQSRKALCVIDLDTVMPGLAAFDFGDSIRFGAASAAEDERDLSKMNFVLELYRVYIEGFLLSCGDSLSEKEIQTLPEGAFTMTLECGVRFLTDYLEGDVYFKTKRPDHNLDRARTQFKLVSGMEKVFDKMKNAASV